MMRRIGVLARSAVPGAADRSAGGRDRATRHRPGGPATRRDRPGSADRAAPRLLGADGRSPDANFADKPWANDYLRIADAQKFATGAGVTVAVIDTGVNGSPRVPAVPGGDFVDKAGNGMSDCDAHGTLTAVDHRGHGPPRPTDSSGSRRTRGSCHCARHRTTFSRSARATTPTTPTRPRRRGRCAAWPGRSCTPPTSARRSSTSARPPATR